MVIVVADVMTIGRNTQVGVESVHGTAPGAGATKQLIDLVFQMDPTYKANEIRGTARRFLSVVVPDGQEASQGKVSGALGYNSWVYVMSMAHGAAVITTPSGGVNARQWKWIIPLTGSVNPVSLDMEQGDSADSEQYLYTICTDWGIDATRAAVAPSATLLARAVNKAGSGGFAGMTSVGVTSVPIQPVLPDDWSIYMDSTSANLGTTKLLRSFHGKLDYGGTYEPFFPLDSALPSYGGVADNPAPKVTFMVELMKDPLVGEALWPVARAGQTEYLRMVAGGVGASPLIDNYVTLTLTGAPTGGNFTLTFNSQTTGNIAFNATAAAVATALQALTAIGATGVTTAGGPLGTAPVTITFTNLLAQTLLPITVGTNALTGGTSPAPNLVATQIPYSMTYDFAGKIAMPGANKDFQGLRTREWTFNIVEDVTWGNALIITMVNNLTAL